MKVYKKDIKVEKKLGRTIKYKFKRFKVCLLICLVFLFVAFLGCLRIINGAGEDLFSNGIFAAILVMFGYNIFPLIGAFISWMVAISGGRDILLTRRNEQIVFLDNVFKIQYTPIYRKLEDGEYVEKTIQYDRIKAIVYDEKFQRLEITTDYTYKLWRYLSFGEQASNIVLSNYSDAEIKIYNCFENMQDLMMELQRVTDKTIQTKQ